MATGLTLVSLADGKNFWGQGGACKTNILQAKSLQLLKVRAKTVRVWDFPKETIVIECGECKRFGRYSKARFVELYGGSTQLPDALDHLTKECPKRSKGPLIFSTGCKAKYGNI